MSKNVALILAGGKGKRMGSKISKQYLLLKGKPILYYTLNVFEKNNNIDAIIIVCREDEIQYCRQIINDYGFKKVIRFVNPGEERQDSVYNGLAEVKGYDIVLIHDGVRPFVNERIINQGIEYAKIYGAAACGVTPKDTIKIKDKDNFSMDTPSRESLICIQTPQCFKCELIIEAHELIREKNIKVTDDTMAIEQLNKKVFLYQGSYSNIKITTPEDLIIGENILNIS